MKQRDDLDRLCDDFALAGLFNSKMFCVRFPADPFLKWVAELGMREGQWIRSHQTVS